MSFWGATTSLGSLSGFLEVSFAANLLYTIVINFGHFSGGSIDRWYAAEVATIQLTLSETSTFNPARFNAQASDLKRRWRRTIRFINVIFICWAVSASVAATVLIFCLAWHPAYQVTGLMALSGAFGLLGAVPLGLGLCVLLHLWARRSMNKLTREWRNALEYFGTAAQVRLATSRDALRRMRDIVE